MVRRAALCVSLSFGSIANLLASVEESVVARIESAHVAVGKSVPIVLEVSGEGAVDPELQELPRVEGLALELESGPTMAAADGGLVARYVILARALEPGEKRIPAFSVLVRSDEMLRTEPLSVMVVDAEDDAIEFVLEPEAEAVYANEPFDLVLRLERPSNSAPTMSRTLRLPWWNRVIVLDGLPELGPRHEVFEVEDRGLRVLFEPIESNGGREILAARLPLLSPESGTLDFSGSVLRFDPRATKPYSESIDGGPRTEIVARSSRISILPWPEGAPPSFVDAVGDFVIAAEVDRPRAGRGELIRFAIHVRAVSGRRTNLRTANFAAPLVIEGFRIHSRRDDRSENDLAMRFEIAATHSKLDAIPALTFSWFDPLRREYATAVVPPTPIVIDEELGARSESSSSRNQDSRAFDWRALLFAALAVAIAVLFARRMRRSSATGSRGVEVDPRSHADRAAARDRLSASTEPFSVTTAREIATALTHRFRLPANACFDATIASDLVAAGAEPDAARLVARYFARVEEAGYSTTFTESEDDREFFLAVVRFAFR